MLLTTLLGLLLVAAPDTTPRMAAPPAPAATTRPLPPGTTADSLVLFKSLRLLVLYHDGAAVRAYRVALGQQPVGPKRFQGDERTPEGLYRIDGRNPESEYHLSLHVSYPNAVDRARAGLWGKQPGGNIMIHGLPPGYESVGVEHTQHDWTDGCIAVTDREMDQLWRAVPDGTPIDLKP